MKKKDILIGRTVMVKPDLSSGPLLRAEQIGKIEKLLPANPDGAMVIFDDKKEAGYFLKNLLALAPKTMILDKIIQLYANWGRSEDIKNMLAIFKLITSGQAQEALILATKSEAIRLLCTMDCYELREIKSKQKNQKVTKRKLQ